MTDYILAEREPLAQMANAVRSATGSTETYTVNELSETVTGILQNSTNEGIKTLRVKGAKPILKGKIPSQIISYFPYRKNGYSSLDLAIGRGENLISSPSSGYDKNLYGISIDVNQTENYWHVYGTRTTDYTRRNIMASNINLTQGKSYIFFGDSNVKINKDPVSYAYIGLQLLENDAIIAQTHQHDPAITVLTPSAATSVKLQLFLWGLYTVDAYYYPTLVEGRKISAPVSNFYGGRFNWTTQELYNDYGADGSYNKVIIPATLAAPEIELSAEENIFYSYGGETELFYSAPSEEYYSNTLIRTFKHTRELKNNGYFLKEGSIVSTLGFYQEEDGGEGTYLIRARKGSDSNLDSSLIFLETEDSSLVAELISSSDKINIKQLGAHGTGTDDTPYFQEALTKYSKVYVPSGKYLINKELEIGEKKILELNNSAQICPVSNHSLFNMKTKSSLLGGEIYTYSLTTNYSADIIKIENNSANDLEQVLIRDTSFFGYPGQGQAIHMTASNSQILYCHFDNIKTNGFATVLIADGELNNGCHNINLISNNAYRVFSGVLNECSLYVTGETGVENSISDYVLNITSGNSSEIKYYMIDTGNPGHIPKSIYLSKLTTKNRISGITYKMGVIENLGLDNDISGFLSDNNAKTGEHIRNHRYNNLFADIYSRANVSINLINCRALGSVAGQAYTEKAFMNDITSIAPQSAWGFEAIDSTKEASVEILISGLAAEIHEFGFEHFDRIGYRRGLSFNKVILSGSTNGGTFSELGRIEYDREQALLIHTSSTINWKNLMEKEDNFPQVYSTFKLTLSFTATESYAGQAYISAIYATGLSPSGHQSFLRSDGSSLYGNLIITPSGGLILVSPNGTNFKINITNDGILTSEEIV